MMIWRWNFCALTAAVLILLIAAETTKAASPHDTKEQALVKWVESHGGYFNPKQAFGEDKNGIFGVFAAEPIQKEQVLMSIPWTCVIASPKSNGVYQDCETVQLLAQLLDKNETLYAAMLHETSQQHADILPMNWSQQGKELLLKVTGNGVLPPEDFFMEDYEWRHSCEAISKQATLLALTHGEEFGMVPLSDKYNSRGGNYTGAYFSIFDGDGDVALEIKALRDLRAGEQIYTDYRDYGQVGTPELLRDYGFVEMYPQRFVFPSHNIAFDVTEAREGNGLEIVEYDLVPSKKAVGFLKRQLKRLIQVYDDLEELEKVASVPSQELQVILRFCMSYIIALHLALENIQTASWRTNSLYF